MYAVWMPIWASFLSEFPEQVHWTSIQNKSPEQWFLCRPQCAKPAANTRILSRSYPLFYLQLSSAKSWRPVNLSGAALEAPKLEPLSRLLKAVSLPLWLVTMNPAWNPDECGLNSQMTQPGGPLIIRESDVQSDVPHSPPWCRARKNVSSICITNLYHKILSQPCMIQVVPQAYITNCVTVPLLDIGLDVSL